jgi:hypothetical protein
MRSIHRYSPPRLAVLSLTLMLPCVSAGAEGVPFVIDEFELLGRYPAFDRFGEARWTPLAGENRQAAP